MENYEILERLAESQPKTSTFEARLDLKDLAYLARALSNKFNLHTPNMSRLIRTSLEVLVQVAMKNNWAEPFDTYKDAYLYLMQNGIYAFNRRIGSALHLNQELEKEVVKEPAVYQHDKERMVQEVERGEGRDKKQ